MTRASWDKTLMDTAHVWAKRSLCARDQVGAAITSIIDGTPHIEATGYNGPPRGMPRPKVAFEGSRVLAHPYAEEYAKALADVGCSSWCPRAQAGAHGDALDPEYHDCPSIHAEANALLYADASKIRGGTIYVTSGICYNCAKLVANSGIARVVCDTTHDAPHRNIDETAAFLERCGITFDQLRH